MIRVASQPGSRRAARSGRAGAGLLMGLLLLGLGAGCTREAPAPTQSRHGRFGSLRDLVLIERTLGEGERALFVDRFEVTREDWQQFAARDAGRAAGSGSQDTTGDAALPVAQVDLRQARAFARWRFARLPTADEWQLTSVGEVSLQLPWGLQRDLYPWGSKLDPTRANTSELGMGDVTPVGTFESGRRSGGETPYDLIGNVGEWTETVAVAWCSEDFDPVASLRRCQQRVLRTPALAVWQGPAGLLPVCFAAEAGGPLVPRLVMGADFTRPMTEPFEVVAAGDRRRSTGLRLFVSAGELLRDLGIHRPGLTADEKEQMRRFLRRGRNAEVLGPVWRRLRDSLMGRGPCAKLLDDELGN
ncbi:MAG: SUMF1/EgtB/PvdO family nonheme iron enzyme [Planctomycetes bacterium]|nr:SUMF1/EgtB/PvdO family nonheme iron enzyme [Planctomycetota bacterium]